MPFPSSDAVSEHVPDDTMVTVSEETVHTPVVVEVSVGVSPDVADGDSVNVDADQERSPSEPKVMLFDGDLAMVTVCVAVACAYCVSPAFVAVTTQVAAALPVAVSAVPETVQSPVTPYETNPTLEPPEVASVMVDPYVMVDEELTLRVACVAKPMLKLCVTLLAALKLSFPA